MYGEDKTLLEELKSAVNKLQELKIEILPKSDKVKDLNNSIDKMENQIKQVDENILNNSQSETTDNETAENKEEQQEIKISENSNLNILISNVDTLIEKVNKAVSVEAERKEEEKTWKEEIAEFEGTYVDIYSDGSSIYTLKADGTLICPSGKIEKPDGLDRRKDGSMFVQTGFNSTVSNDQVPKGYYLYPIGVGGYYEGDNTKLRLGYSDGVSIIICEKK